jgi:arylsulfatase
MALLGCLAGVLPLVGRAEPVAPRAPDIIFILIDTLRADRVGAFGNRRGLTPFLDSLAARGTAFQRTYAQSSWTSPSIASLLTSRFVSQHGVVSPFSVLQDAENTLPEALQRSGYMTAGFVANDLMASAFGMAQGYDHYEAFPTQSSDTGLPMPVRAPVLNDAALGWLGTNAAKGQKSRRPYFVYLHYMEPHSPYAPSPEAMKHVLGSPPWHDVKEVNDTFFMSMKGPVERRALQSIEDTYDAQVLTLDRQLAQFFETLESRGLLEHAAIVVTADHGEEFKEHGLMSHGNTLFNEVTHVPLVVVPPWRSSRRDVWRVASVIDVAPTVLELAGVDRPVSFEGHSLRAELGDARWRDTVLRRLRTPWSPDAGAALSELPQSIATPYRRHSRALVHGDEKLLENVDGTDVFVELATDPGERALVKLPAERRKSLREVRDALTARTERNRFGERRRELDPGTRDRLRALGYVE